MSEDMMNDFLDEIDDAEVLELGINIEDTDFRVMNKGQANFFLRKIKEIEQENEEINAFCDEQIKAYTDKTNNYREKQVLSNNRTLEHFSNLLQQFADLELEKDPKKKSVKLPFGTIGYKKSQDKLVIENESFLIASLKDYGLPGVKVVEKEVLDKKLIKSSIEAREDGFYIDGIKMSGVAIEKGAPVFGVKTIKE